MRRIRTAASACLLAACALSAMAVGGSRRAGRPAAASVLGISQAEPSPELFDDGLVRDVSITVPGSNWLTVLGCVRSRTQPGGAAAAGQDVAATLVVDGVSLGDVGVRCKGNSSLNINGTKKPLNVTTDSFVPGQDLWGIDIINLNNNWSDPSQLREAIALRFMAEYLPVSRFSFARVTMNGSYLGLYTMVEQVNGEWADHWYPDDGGMIIKGDSPTRIAFNSSTLNWQGEDIQAYKQDYEAKGAAAGLDAPYEQLREFIRKLDAPVTAGGLSDQEFREGIRQVLDVESALWYLATSNLLANFDSYYVGKNYYLYLGQRDPRFHVVPWDLGLSFGLFGLQDGETRAPDQSADPAQWPVPPDPGASAAQADPFAQSTNRNRPLIRRLLAVPDYRADYIAHYRALVAESFTSEWLGEVGARYQQLVRQAARDEAAAQGRISGAFTFDQFVANLTTDMFSSGRPGGSMRGGAPGILSLVDERIAYLDTLEAFEPPEVHLVDQSRTPERVSAGDVVELRATFAGAAAAGVQVRYRVDGGFENVLTASLDGDGTWRATIPAARQGAAVSYVYRLALADGRAVFYPSATLTRPYYYEVAGVSLPMQATGDLVLNEAMASNSDTIADESGRYPDWVELYNRGQSSIDLADYYMSDDRDDPWEYRLPDRRLAPGERLIVWCDNDPDEGELHAPFRLDADGETLYLATLEAVVEAQDLPAMLPDQSYMRLPDGADAWVLCEAGTPNLANECAPEALRTPATPEPTTVPSVSPSATTPSSPTAAPTTSTPTPRPSATTPPVTDYLALLPLLQRHRY